MVAGDKKRSRKRRNSEDSEGSGPPRVLKVVQQYTVEEKLEIIDFAKSNGNRAAGREYNVAESSIREWRKNEEKLKNMADADPDRNRVSTLQRRSQPAKAEKPEIDSEQQSLQFIEVPLSFVGSDSAQRPLSSTLNLNVNGFGSNTDLADMLGFSPNHHHLLPTCSPSNSSSGGSVSPHTETSCSGGSSSRRKSRVPQKLALEQIEAASLAADA